MTDNNFINTIEEELQLDRKSRSPRYPEQALAAISDPKLAKALERHMAKGARLVDIRALPYEATLGLIPVVFELEPPGRVNLRHPSVLSLIDGSSQVVAVIDGFNPDQPNPNYAPPDKPGDQPFALLDASVAESIKFSEEDVAPTWERTREYIRKAAPNYQIRGRNGGSEGTLCQQSTITNTQLTAIPTFSGGLFIRQVDDFQTLTQPDSFADIVEDDSIVVEPIQ